MNKLFKPKTMRRIFLFMALIFPVVYLCGGLFFALNGAHGENVLATDESSIVAYRTVNFNQLVVNGNFEDTSSFAVASCTLSVNGNIGTVTSTNGAAYSRLQFSVPFVSGHKYLVSVKSRKITDSARLSVGFYQVGNSGAISTMLATSLTTEFVRYQNIIQCGYNNDNAYNTNLYFVPDSAGEIGTQIQISELMVFDLSNIYGLGNEVGLDDFNLSFSDSYYPYTLSDIRRIPVYGVPNEQNSLFYHLFGQRNFVSDIGREVMQGTADGFAPMNDLFRVVNDNVLHFDENDSLAVFGFGYLYYAVNVIVIYEVVTIALKLLLLPLKVVDKLEVEKND